MALLRRNREERTGLIWPGFVDALTALLLVLMFVLSIFMIVQFMLREQISGKDKSLASLSAQLVDLGEILSLEQNRNADLEADINRLSSSLAASNQANATLESQLDTQISEVARLNALADALRKERDAAQGEVITARNMTAEIRQLLAQAQDTAAQAELTARERIAALELALKERARKAEETLLLLAAAQAAEAKLTEEMRVQAAEIDAKTALATLAQSQLEGMQVDNQEQRKAIALLNIQLQELRRQLGGLQDQLAESEMRDVESKAQIANLGSRLNAALAQAVALKAKQVNELEQYRSEFFGRMRKLLEGRKEIRIVGDRFVLQSEVLFGPGSAELAEAGKREIAKLAVILRDVANGIPREIDWVLRVDGHTDQQPLSSNALYADNWELSQARALSVVRYLEQSQNIPAKHLVAAGFGEHHPLDTGKTRSAFAKNRRIELKFTKR